jgi:hypothetical protein
MTEQNNAVVENEQPEVPTEVVETSSDWDSIPEDLRNTTELKAFEKGKTPALAKSYVELSKSASGKIRIPDEKATPEELKKFNAAIAPFLGIPESPDKYQIKAPELSDEEKAMGITYSPDLEKGFKEAAHKAGFNSKQVQAAIDFQMNMIKQGAAQQVAEVNKLNEGRWEKLKSEWGDVKTNENIELTKRAFNEFAPEELKEMMTADDAIKDPILVKMYSNIWRKTMDDTLIKGDAADKVEENPPYPKSPEMYSRNDKWRPWFEKRGYDYATNSWKGGKPQ